MRTGLQALADSLAKPQGGQTFTKSINYFKWADGDTKIVRFLTDDIITANFYEYVVDARGKFQNFLYSPEVFGEGTEDFVKKYGGKCYEKGNSGPLVEPKLIERTAGIAVLRKEISKPGGSGTEIVDYTEDITVGDQQFKARWFGIIRQAKRNFWDQLSSLGMRYGTLCDRDYEIKRTGSKLDTTYSIIPLDPDPELRDMEVLHKFYGYGKPWNPEDPNRFLNCPQTLHQWAEYYAGEERVKYFLVDSNSAETPAPQKNSSSGFSGSSDDEAQVSVSENTEFGASLRDLLLKNK